MTYYVIKQGQKDRRTGIPAAWELPGRPDCPVRLKPAKCISPALVEMESPTLHGVSDWEEIANIYRECDYCYEVVKYQLTHPASEHVVRMLDDWGRHLKSRKCLKFKKTSTHVGNGAPNGAFAFTITKSPEDAFSIGDMLSAVRKVMGQRSKKVVRYAWYYEDKGTDGLGSPIHPHIHGMYETENGGRIEAKHWMRAWPIWDEKKPMGSGFRGGYHRPVRHDDAYSDYIKKDGGLSESLGID